VPGHWEGDLVFGRRPSAVGTLVERHSRYVLLFALADGLTAQSMRPALTAAVLRLPEQLRRSLTWDHGREMAEHLQFTIDSGVQVFFCDPRSPWQRGTNENTNGLLRQYLPKSADLRQFDQAALDAIAAELNGRPRQTLGFKTPSQALAGRIAEVVLQERKHAEGKRTGQQQATDPVTGPMDADQRTDDDAEELQCDQQPILDKDGRGHRSRAEHLQQQRRHRQRHGQPAQHPDEPDDPRSPC
jgi:hypothetical protein